MNKRFAALSFVFALGISSLCGQNFNIRWSPVMENEDYIKESTIVLNDPAGYTYFVVLHSQKHFVIDKLNESFVTVWTQSFFNDKITGTDFKFSYESIDLRENTIEFILSYMDPRTKTSGLISFGIDTGGGRIQEPKTLFSMNQTQPRNSYYLIKYTPDRKHKIIFTSIEAKNFDHRFKLNYIITDPHFQILTENSITIPFALKDFYIENLWVDDNLNVFIAGIQHVREERFREAPYRHVIYSWIHDLSLLRICEIDIGNEFMLGSKLLRYNEDSLLVCGLYGRAYGLRNQWTDSDTKGVFLTWLDKNGNRIAPVRMFSIDSLPLPPWFERKKLSARDIVRFSNGEFALIARHSFTRCANASCQYLSNHVYIFYFDINRNISRVSGIPKKQRQTNFDAYISHVYFLTGDTLCFLYNESKINFERQLKKRDVFNPKTDRGVIVCSSFYPDGSDKTTLLNNDTEDPFLLLTRKCFANPYDERSITLITSQNEGMQRYKGMRIGVLKF